MFHAKSRSRRATVAAAIAVTTALLVLGGCSDDAPSTTTLTIIQQPPELASFAIPATTSDPGAPAPDTDQTPAGVLAFDAEITDPDGRTGILIGFLLTADLPDATTGGTLEERIGTLVYAFGEDELVVSGGTSYPLESAEMAAGQPQRRAVVGGTGSYVGARGDGSYTHVFTLVN